jgi:hypothetical protein
MAERHHWGRHTLGGASLLHQYLRRYGFVHHFVIFGPQGDHGELMLLYLANGDADPGWAEEIPR